mgnify:CR=1 FL=1
MGARQCLMNGGVWLLVLHRRRYRQFGRYNHTVFVTYSIAFMNLALIVVTLPLHMYRRLRGAYSLSHRSAAWRTVALLLMTIATTTIFLFLLLALGILA